MNFGTGNGAEKRLYLLKDYISFLYIVGRKITRRSATSGILFNVQIFENFTKETCEYNTSDTQNFQEEKKT